MMAVRLTAKRRGTRRPGIETTQGVNIREAKRRLSELVAKAAAGEDVVVCRYGEPVARITRLDPPKRRIGFGLLEGRLIISDDFDAPLPSDLLRSFEGR